MPRDYHIAKRDILESMPGTVAQLVKKSGYHRATVERWLRKLRAADGSHIVDWQRPNGAGNFIPVHGAGTGVDVPCTLVALTSSEKWKATVRRLGRDRVRQLERARAWALQARRSGFGRDPLLGALFAARRNSPT